MNRKQLLDIGCGDASQSIYFAKQGYVVIGVEKSKKIYLKANSNVEKSGQKKFIKLYNKDIRKMKFHNKFSGILFNYILMLMPKNDSLSLIDTYYKKLRVNGEMIIKMLMFDDPIAINLSGNKKYFYPTYDEFEKIGMKYEAEIKFELLRNPPHGRCDYYHIHSVGIMKIVKKRT